MSRTTAELRQLAEHWIEAWNAHDLDAIMSHYAADIAFTADTIVRRWHKPDGTLRGIAELHQHFQRGLGLAPTLHFDLVGVFSSPKGYAILYRRDNGNQVIDAVELDAENRATRVTAFYAGEQK